jgi:hypothetical protein
MLKGGFSALIGYLGPMDANTPHKSDTAKK